MSHGDRVDALPPGFRAVAASEAAPYAVIADDEQAFLRRPLSSRGRAHAAGRRAVAQLHPQGRRLSRRLDDGAVPRSRRSTRSAAKSAKGGVVCGLSGGVDSAGRGGAAPRGDRRPADLHLCRHRPVAARARPRRSSSCSAATTTSRSSIATPATCFSAKLAGVTDPEEKRKSNRRRLHRRLRRGGARSSAASSSWRRGRSIPT